jgi:hypothetical protein
MNETLESPSPEEHTMSDEKRPWPGPPAGVSTTDGAGGHAPINDPSARPRGAGRRRQAGDDILQNVEQLRRVGGSEGMNPAGTKGVQKDIRIGNMPKTRRSRRHHVSFQSIDGQSYTFRTHDTKGTQLQYLPTQVLYMCLRELSLGGSALPILRAFNVNFNDEDGQQFLPVSEEALSQTDDYNGDDYEGQSLSLGQAE